MYWKNGRAKLEIGLAKGKQLHDKRASIERPRLATGKGPDFEEGLRSGERLKVKNPPIKRGRSLTLDSYLAAIKLKK